MMDMRVIIIDDDQEHLNIMERRLKREPWIESILALRNEIGVTNAVRVFDPDVVLMDLKMPHISGEELLEILMRDDQVPDACYIVFSGSDATLLRRVQLRTGAELALSKSVDLGNVVHHIHSFEGQRDKKRKRRLSIARATRLANKPC
ncbi:MAG TPA: response regulator [Vicinamibacterales bacterium]|nr:response regulator [Vicinamibacterales bacterium]